MDCQRRDAAINICRQDRALTQKNLRPFRSYVKTSAWSTTRVPLRSTGEARSGRWPQSETMTVEENNTYKREEMKKNWIVLIFCILALSAIGETRADDREIASEALSNPNPTLFETKDDRIPVARPEIWPYRTVGQIVVTLTDGRSHTASGTLISDYTVLTAGHVVKDDNNKFLPIRSLRFIPARNHSSQPYGQFDWVYMRAVKGGARDFALISLAQGAGFRTGYCGARVKLPIGRWQVTQEGDHFCHIGFPGDHRDEMWIDEDGVCTGIRDGRQLKTNIDAARGQSGGPLAQNWPTRPMVVGALVGGPNDVEDPNYFMPGWETDKNDTWFEWLCNEFGKKHADDRFEGCNRVLKDGDGFETEGLLPDYTKSSYFADDNGPDVRRFYNSSKTLRLTPRHHLHD